METAVSRGRSGDGIASYVDHLWHGGSPSLRPAIHGPGKRRLPLLERSGDVQRVRAAGAKGHIGDVGRGHFDDPHQFFFLVHDEHATGAVLRDVIVAVGAQFNSIRTVVGVLVWRGWREVLQARPYDPGTQSPVG